MGAYAPPFSLLYVANMPFKVIERVNLRRLDDPLGGFRELLLWQRDNHYSVEQLFGFLSGPDPVPIYRRETIGNGGEVQMRKLLSSESKRLEAEDDFIITESTA